MTTTTPTNLTEDQLIAKLKREEIKFRFLVPSVVLKLRYKFWLALIRETSILIQLIPHYKEIPKRTPTKVIVGLFVKSSHMKNLLLAVDKRLRKRIY